MIVRFALAALFGGATMLSQAQQFVISTLSGGLLLPSTPVPATNVAIGSPSAVTTDAAGNVYFAGLYAVFNVDQNGVLTHVAGNGTPGRWPEFGTMYVDSSDGGPAIKAQLFRPTALALDNSGNLYIADTLNHVIRKVSSSGMITTVSGNSTLGSCEPSGVAVDKVATCTSRIPAITASGGLL